VVDGEKIERTERLGPTMVNRRGLCSVIPVQWKGIRVRDESGIAPVWQDEPVPLARLTVNDGNEPMDGRLGL
jgi:hypothetical protein